MTDCSDVLNTLKRVKNRFDTDGTYADAIKRCSALLIGACDSVEEANEACVLITLMIKENWKLKSENHGTKSVTKQKPRE